MIHVRMKENSVCAPPTQAEEFCRKLCNNEKRKLSALIAVNKETDLLTIHLTLGDAIDRFTFIIRSKSGTPMNMSQTA